MFDCERSTALHKASLKGNADIVSYLLRCKAKPNARDADLCTPLHYAAENRFPVVVEKLLIYGADIEAVDKEGQARFFFSFLMFFKAFGIWT